ncbi:MAG: translation initiation factor IF-2 [Vampirovibrionales bacterium]
MMMNATSSTAKVRVYEIAKRLDIPNKDLLTFIDAHFDLGIKSHSSSIDASLGDTIAAKYQALHAPQPEAVKASITPQEPIAPPKAPTVAPPVPTASKPAHHHEARPVHPSPAVAAPSKQAQKPSVNAQTPQPTQQAPQGKGQAPQPQPERGTQQGNTSQKWQGKSKGHQGKGGKNTPVEDTTPDVFVLNAPMTVSELAEYLKVRSAEVIKQLFLKGTPVTVNSLLDVPLTHQVADLLEITYTKGEDITETNTEATHDVLSQTTKTKVDLSGCQNLAGRPPVISIMGHVDHGKTSLLDAIREVRHKIVDTEAGGITQRIGAYTVEKDDQTIVFLDTPGHEAFTAMRMRGAKATDIAILVVAADDGVKPQTIEAIQHAKAAEIPIIVAVNKIDKPGADPERVLVQLSEHGLVSEKWGGDVVTVEVSALQKLGIDDLLEMIVLVSELLDLQADATVDAEGVIVEARLDKGKGPVATLLVQNGTLTQGDFILCGQVSGRVRALHNDAGVRCKEAGPSQPVELLGLSDVPQAGEVFKCFPTEKALRQYQQQQQTEQELLAQQQAQNNQAVFNARRSSLAVKSGDTGTPDTFNIVIKADSQGAVEAVTNALSGLTVEHLSAQVIYQGTGDMTATDLMLASASHAIVVGFNVREDISLKNSPLMGTVPIYKYDVIYHLVESVQKLMLSRIKPEMREVKSGVAEIRALFTINNQMVAGCMVLEGKVQRNARISIKRGKEEIYNGSFNSLRHFKDNVKEVRAGLECGCTFVKFDEVQQGDIIETYVMETVELKGV